MPSQGCWMATPFSSEGNRDRKSTRLNSSHLVISYAVFCLKKKKHHVQALHLLLEPKHSHSGQGNHANLINCKIQSIQKLTYNIILHTSISLLRTTQRNDIN